MKKKIQLLIISVLIFSCISILNSCKKEKEKGCTDPLSLNYNSNAEEDDGSCTYSSDKLTGTWNVSETVSGNSVNYSATITKNDNNNVTISSTRTNPPMYYMNNLLVTVKWTEKKIEKTGTTVSGTITNENDFEIHYLYGAGANVYNVSQHYTR